MKKALFIVLGLLVLIQLVPVDRNNPPSSAPLAGPAELVAVLDQSCYDCHSNNTRWPWYSYVAPVSWLVASDVEEGRKHLNFSEWAGLDRARQIKKVDEIREETSEGEMPLGIYLTLHGDAKLTAEDLATINSWVISFGTGPSTPDVGEAATEDGEDDH
jgi:hypothetical protein